MGQRKRFLTRHWIVTRAAAATAGRFSAEGYDTVFDGMVGPWFLPAFVDASGVDRLDYVVLLPSFERCLHRVRTRVGHGFTDEAATRKMHDSFAGADIERRHVLVDPPGGPEAVADLVAAARASGRLRCDHAGPGTRRLTSGGGSARLRD